MEKTMLWLRVSEIYLALLPKTGMSEVSLKMCSGVMESQPALTGFAAFSTVNPPPCSLPPAVKVQSTVKNCNKKKINANLYRLLNTLTQLNLFILVLLSFVFLFY